jgi:hypothetical protein
MTISTPVFFSHLDVAKPHWRPNKSGRPWGEVETYQLIRYLAALEFE